MSHYIALVSDFHRAFNHPQRGIPSIPAKERATLRIALLREELDELQAAVDANDLVEVADALADLQYVLSGAVLEFGLPFVFDDLFDEVHRSNMSKQWSQQEAQDATGLNFVSASAGKYIGYNSIGKVVKPPSYSPADLQTILEPYLNDATNG